MIEFSHISKLLIKKKLKILTNTEKVQLKKFNKKHPFLKEIKISELIDSVNSYSKIDKENAWKLIEARTKTERPVIKLFKKRWYGYAASLVLILTSAYFLKDILFQTVIPNNSNQTETSNILKGTDKATLTLADGSEVFLEKGTAVKTQNANSNGKEIVYTANTKRTATVIYNRLTIPRGGQFFIKLADGTQVWLNSESQLKYPVAFIEGKTREVELIYGEAYFEVTPSSQNNGAKFKVINKSQEIEVLGTAFNIKAYKDENTIYTTLAEGSVAITFDNKSEILVPNQQSIFNTTNSNFKLKTVDVYNEISWKDGVFSFERKPLKDIMKVFARWYDMEVVFENKSLEDEKFFGVLDKEQSIKEILETIKNFKIIENYEIKDKTIILK
jgi:ferric-dicitrate binding protein FerR (iron transport regulator)